MRTLDERYLNDPVFHQLVDFMLHAVQTLNVTPTEVREAAIFAQIKYELTSSPRPIYLSEDLMRYLK